MRCIVASALMGSGLQGWSRGVVRAAEPDQEPQLEIQVRRTRLDNGLRVVLSRDISRPTVAICLMYAVGARDEPPGQRGVSLLLERILSHGAESRGASVLETIAGHGGRGRVRAAADRTEFHALLPSNALEMGIAIAGERMLQPALTAERFETERRALLAELRAGSTVRAYDDGYRELRSLMFASPAPEGGAGASSRVGDLERATLERARSFVDGSYAPNKAVLALAGNFEVVEALKLIRRHFGRARRTETPAIVAPSVPEQTQPRLVSTRDELARTPATFSGWAIPPAGVPEHHALELAAIILARGESSRLHQLLVRQESLAREVEAWTAGESGADSFGLRIVLDEGSDADLVHRLSKAQIGALGRWGPTTGELDRAKHQLRAAFLRGLDGNLARGRRLAGFELFRGDAEELTRELARYATVTREDLQRAVGRYLVPARENRVMVIPEVAARAREGSRAPSPWFGERLTSDAP